MNFLAKVHLQHQTRGGTALAPLRRKNAACGRAIPEPKLAGSGRLLSKRAGPAVRIHLAPPTSHCEPMPGSGIMTRRIAELDHEWDVERALEANAATASLLRCLLGATVQSALFPL